MKILPFVRQAGACLSLPRPASGLRVTALLALLVILQSCQSINFQHLQEDIDSLIAAGQWEAAAELHREKSGVYRKNDRLLYLLNQGMLNYYAGIENDKIFEEAYRYYDVHSSDIDKIYAFPTMGLSYPSSSQESLWMHGFNALSYLRQGSLSGALVEVRRIHQREALLKNLEEEIGIEAYSNSAFLSYLSSILYRHEEEGDSFRIERDAVARLVGRDKAELLPENPQNREAGKQFVNFMIFTGRGVRVIAHTVGMASVPGALVFTAAQGEGPVADYLGVSSIPYSGQSFSYYQFQVPEVRRKQGSVTAIEIWQGGSKGEEPQKIGELRKLEDFAGVNEQRFRQRVKKQFPAQILQFVVKIIANELAATAIQKGVDPLLGTISQFVGSMAVSASSLADLRIASYFPSDVWVSELQLEPRKQNLELRYYSKGQLLASRSYEVGAGTDAEFLLQDYLAK